MGSQPKQTERDAPLGGTSKNTQGEFKTPFVASPESAALENQPLLGLVNETPKPALIDFDGESIIVKPGAFTVVRATGSSSLIINSHIKFRFIDDEVLVEDDKAEVAGLEDHGELEPLSEHVPEVDFAFALVSPGEGDK